MGLVWFFEAKLLYHWMVHCRSPGSFCGLQLLAGEGLERVVAGLHRRLAQVLMEQPPYEMGWVKRHPARSSILEVVLDAGVDPGGLQARAGLQEDQLHQVLALRGLLGCNLLQHCLQRRHLVDYGVNRWVV